MFVLNLNVWDTAEANVVVSKQVQPRKICSFYFFCFALFAKKTNQYIRNKYWSQSMITPSPTGSTTGVLLAYANGAKFYSTPHRQYRIHNGFVPITSVEFHESVRNETLVQQKYYSAVDYFNEFFPIPQLQIKSPKVRATFVSDKNEEYELYIDHFNNVHMVKEPANEFGIRDLFEELFALIRRFGLISVAYDVPLDNVLFLFNTDEDESREHIFVAEHTIREIRRHGWLNLRDLMEDGDDYTFRQYTVTEKDMIGKEYKAFGRPSNEELDNLRRVNVRDFEHLQWQSVELIDFEYNDVGYVVLFDYIERWFTVETLEEQWAMEDIERKHV